MHIFTVARPTMSLPRRFVGTPHGKKDHVGFLQAFSPTERLTKTLQPWSFTVRVWQRGILHQHFILFYHEEPSRLEMGEGIDELIEWLLAEIAFSGEQGEFIC